MQKLIVSSEENSSAQTGGDSNESSTTNSNDVDKTDILDLNNKEKDSSLFDDSGNENDDGQ